MHRHVKGIFYQVRIISLGLITRSRQLLFSKRNVVLAFQELQMAQLDTTGRENFPFVSYPAKTQTVIID